MIIPGTVHTPTPGVWYVHAHIWSDAHARSGSVMRTRSLLEGHILSLTEQALASGPFSRTAVRERSILSTLIFRRPVAAPKESEDVEEVMG